MAIQVQKLLPQAKVTRISSPSSAIVVAKPTTEAAYSFKGVSEKVSVLGSLFQSILNLKQTSNKRRKTVLQRQKTKEREDKLEAKKREPNSKDTNDMLTAVPGRSIIDSLIRFGGFTLIGFFAKQATLLLPKLEEFGETIKPGMRAFAIFADSLVGNTIDFIDRGYQAYDTVRGWVKSIGGENFVDIFDKFSGALNIFVQGTVLAGLAGGFGGKDTTLRGKTGEALQQGKTVFSGESALAAKNKRRVFGSIIERKATLAKRRQTRRKLADRQRLFRMRDLMLRKQENRDRLEKAKIARENREIAKKANKMGVGDSFRKLTSRGFTADRALEESMDAMGMTTPKKKKKTTIPKKPPKTVRMGKVKYAEMRGGDFVDFGLPGKPTRRFTPQQAEGILHMFENPKDRYTKQIAYQAFDNPELYDVEIRQNYRESVKKRFRAAKLRRPDAPRGALLSASAAKEAGKKGAKQALRKGTRFVPFIGPLLDITISIISGDPIDEAIVGTLGATLGGFLGTAIVGAGTFGLGAVLGAGIGSLVGDIIARSLYDTAKRMFFQKQKGFNEGGQVGRSIRIPEASDRRREVRAPIVPQPTIVGKNVNVDFKKLYGEKGLASLISSSRIIKNEQMFAGIFGAIGGAYVDMLLGQAPDTDLASAIGRAIGMMTNEAYGKEVGDSLARSLKRTSASIFRTLYGGAGQPVPEEVMTELLNGNLGDSYRGRYGLPALPPTNTIPGQQYGDSRDGGTRSHAGVDFDISGDEKFYSRIGGKVVGIYFDKGGYGHYVDIYNKALGVTERIAEGRQVLVKTGDIINPGQPVVQGESETGVIHYEIRKGKSGPEGGFSGTMNPLEFLRGLNEYQGGPQSSIAPGSYSKDIAALQQEASYESGIHERNLLMFQQETVFVG